MTPSGSSRSVRKYRSDRALWWTPSARRIGLIALGMLAAAVNTGNNLLYLMLGILLATLPLSWLVSRRHLSALEVDLRVPRHARNGSAYPVEITLTHRGGWFDARGLDVRVPGPDGLRARGFVEHLASGSKLRLTIPTIPEGRGPERLEGVRVASTYPFGFLGRSRLWKKPCEVLVLPATDRTVDASSRSLARSGDGALSPRVVGNEYCGLRRGDENDDVRRIDWKTSARRGELVLRETAGESQSSVELDVRTRCPGPPEEARSAFEDHLAGIAGRAREVLESGGTIFLSVDGASPLEARGRGDLLPVLSRLARLEPLDESGTPIAAPRCRLTAEKPTDTARQSPPGLAHRHAVLAALAVSVVALVSYGGIGPVSFAVLIGSIGLSLSAPRLVARRGGIANRLWQILGMAALGLFLAELFVVRNPLSASLHFVTALTIYQIFNAVSTRDDRLLLLLSMLYMILATALTTEVSFAVPLLAWLFAVACALIGWSSMPSGDGRGQAALEFDARAGRLRYGRPAGTSVAAVVAVGLVIFFLVPHLGTGAFSPSGAMRRTTTGFSDTARLGDIGRIKLDTSPVMEVEVWGNAADHADLRWRGAALERFDGRTWSRVPGNAESYLADESGRIDLSANSPIEGVVEQRIHREPNGTRVLFAAERAERISSGDFDAVLRDEAGTIEAGIRSSRRVTYSVRSRPVSARPDELRIESGPDPEAVSRRNLQLPPLDARIVDLAQRLTSGTDTRYDAVTRIERWISEEHGYTLQVQDSGLDDPLASFLLGDIDGHCEYFATGMVVLARSSGIPARFVAGYVRGETNRFNRRYLVRQSDAHAWVEVYFPQSGWVTFDPTPAAGRSMVDEGGVADLFSDLHATIARWWDDHLIGVDMQDQFGRLLAVRDGLLVAWRGLTRIRWPAWVGIALAVLLVLAMLGIRAMRVPGGTSTSRAMASPPPRFYRDLQAFLEARGLARRPDETPGELAARARRELPANAGERVRELTELYYRVRFDESTREPQVRRLARSLLLDLRQQIRQTEA